MREPSSLERLSKPWSVQCANGNFSRDMKLAAEDKVGGRG